MGDGDVFSRLRTALSEGLCVVEGHLVAEVLDVVGVDVVQSGRSLGIAFGVDVAAEFVNLFLGDDVPSRTVVLDVGMDGAQESGLLEEVEEVNLRRVAVATHEVELLLSVVGRIARKVAVALYEFAVGVG